MTHAHFLARRKRLLKTIAAAPARKQAIPERHL